MLRKLRQRFQIITSQVKKTTVRVDDSCLARDCTLKLTCYTCDLLNEVRVYQYHSYMRWYSLLSDMK